MHMLSLSCYCICHPQLYCRKVHLVIREALSGELVPDLPSKGVVNWSGNKYCELNNTRSQRSILQKFQALKKALLRTVKCYSASWNKIFLTTVLGEFYLSGKFSLNLPMPLPHLIQPNPYCIIQSKKSFSKTDLQSTTHLLKNSSTYQRGLAYLKANITTTLQQFDDGLTDLIATSFLHNNLVG